MKNKIKLLSLLLIGGLILSFGSCRKSYEPGDWDIIPEPIEPPIEEVGKTITLKVMAYYGREHANFQGVIDHIKKYDPDLLYIRQIDQLTTRTNKTDVPKVYGEGLDMEYFFGKAFDYQGGGFGNAVFSKFPIVETDVITMLGDLSLTSKPEVRSLAMITVQIDEKNLLTFAGTELDPGQITSRVSQTGDVLRKTIGVETPFILAANFNDTDANGQVFNMVRDQFTFGCISCPANSPKAKPDRTLDYFVFKEADDFIVDSYTPFTVGTPDALNILPMTMEIKMKLVE